jgi:surface protein
MGGMFYNTPFNQDISSWDVSNVTNMSDMFYNAASFNQDIGSWNVSGVTDMSYMFVNATAFNQDLSSWCVTNIPSIPTDFDTGATSWVLPKRIAPAWAQGPSQASSMTTTIPLSRIQSAFVWLRWVKNLAR